MKNILYTLFLFFDITAFAQQPEKVYHTIQNEQNYTWYVVQAKAWRYEVDQDKKNADAWMQYYFANYYGLRLKRNGIPMTSRSTAEWDENRKAMADRVMADSAVLTDILKEMKQEVDGTFEYYFADWFNTMSFRGRRAAIPLLEKAYNKDPERVEAFPELITQYDLDRDIHLRDQLLMRWHESGDFSQGLLHYYYNVLMSVEQNGILCTDDIPSHYATLMLQVIMGVRKDITVIWTGGMGYPAYNKRVYAENGVKVSEQPDPKHAMVESVFPGATKGFSVGNFIDDLVYNKKGKPVYITPGIAYMSSGLEKKAYLVGLAMKISDERFDNIAVIRKNVEQHFALDYLSNRFYIEKSQAIINECHENYVVPLLHLYNHYYLAGEMDKAAKTKALLLKIADSSIKSAKVFEFFKKYEK